MAIPLLRLVSLLLDRGFKFGWTWKFSAAWWNNSMSYKFFTDKEASGLDAELMSKLDTARAVAGIPFRITSGLRSCTANTVAMGVENSSHLSGKAVDLAVQDSRDRFMIIKGLLAAGFVRIGAYDRHIHCDVDQSKDQNVIWVGVSH